MELLLLILLIVWLAPALVGRPNGVDNTLIVVLLVVFVLLYFGAPHGGYGNLRLWRW